MQRDGVAGVAVADSEGENDDELGVLSAMDCMMACAMLLVLLFLQ